MKQTEKQTESKSNRKDRKWMQNPKQLKNPKVFNVTLVRNPDKSFHVIGMESRVLIRKNQHSGVWTSVDTRDLARELNNSKITSL